MFMKKKKEAKKNKGLLAPISLAVGAALGFAYAMLSAKKTGKEFQKELKAKANKAFSDSKKKIGKEFVRARKEIGTEFESHLIKTFSDLKSKSQDWIKQLVH
jgi:gas vesicle protein